MPKARRAVICSIVALALAVATPVWLIDVQAATPEQEKARCENPPVKSEQEWLAFAKKLAGRKGCVTAGERNQYELAIGCKYPTSSRQFPARCEKEGDRPTWR